MESRSKSTKALSPGGNSDVVNGNEVRSLNSDDIPVGPADDKGKEQQTAGRAQILSKDANASGQFLRSPKEVVSSRAVTVDASGRRQVIKVRVPATSANIGPGYDVLGMAVDLWNDLTVSRAKKFQITVEGQGRAEIPTDIEPQTGECKNLVVKACRRAYQHMELEMPPLHFRINNRIPFGKGLGSSSAAIVSGLLAGLALEDRTASLDNEEELLQLACEIEGHPDNVAPCIYGGMQLGYSITAAEAKLYDRRRELSGVSPYKNGPFEDGRFRSRESPVEGQQLFTKVPSPPPALNDGKIWCTSRVRLPLGLVCVVFTPFHATETTLARGLLPDVIPRGEAIFNMSRLALLINALQDDRHDLLRIATQDALHQDARAAKVHRHLKPVIEAALAAGAKGCFLSGAGPSVMAFCSGRQGDVFTQTNRERTEQEVAKAMLKIADSMGCKGEVLITVPVDHGAHVVASDSNLGEKTGLASESRIHYVLNQR
ncbi:unnamed protein product [Amoebophrya sp. A25]|nr:unnamed protein product [Amoebophrya sp. A25]|eukprot:GSA25T00009896001.1